MVTPNGKTNKDKGCKMVRTIKHNRQYYDIVWSPDDNFWYIRRYSDNYTSQPFDSEEALIRAFVDKKIDWEA